MAFNWNDAFLEVVASKRRAILTLSNGHSMAAAHAGLAKPSRSTAAQLIQMILSYTFWNKLTTVVLMPPMLRGQSGT